MRAATLERISVFSPMIWVAVLAIILLNEKKKVIK